jgi:hypothetical protein
MNMSFDNNTEELLLYANNDEPLYLRKMNSFLPNVRRKIEQGKYDPALAPKLWIYWIDEAAKKYAREFPGTKFSLASRQKAAAEVAARELQALMSGEYGPPPVFKAKRGRAAHSPGGGARGGAMKYVVRGKSGKVAGRYATRAEAERRIAQLKAGASRLKAFQFGGGRSAKSPGWQVVVGNIGTVFDGTRESAARVVFKDYVILSKSNNGRAGGESVTLLDPSGEPIAEHVGANEE